MTWTDVRPGHNFGIQVPLFRRHGREYGQYAYRAKVLASELLAGNDLYYYLSLHHI